jgi:CheY-like chemotaxis protein
MQLNLLIVEDSVSYAVELEQLATEIGYNVIAVTDNSADALDIIFSQQPDIILMDICIKGRLSGIDIGKRIKHLDIPILYITSFDDKKTFDTSSSQ